MTRSYIRLFYGVVMGLVFLLVSSSAHAFPKVVFENGVYVYSMPILVGFTFGAFGLMTLLFSFFCPQPMRKMLHMGGSVVVALQYVFLIDNLQQYPEVFRPTDGFLMPLFILASWEAYQSANTLVTLILPCLVIVLSTVMVPVVWYFPHLVEDGLDRLTGKIQDADANES